MTKKVKYHSLSKDIKDKIIENNRLDIDLYNYAKHKFFELTKDIEDDTNVSSSNITNRLISINNLILKRLFEKFIVRILY